MVSIWPVSIPRKRTVQEQQSDNGGTEEQTKHAHQGDVVESTAHERSEIRRRRRQESRRQGRASGEFISVLLAKGDLGVWVDVACVAC